MSLPVGEPRAHGKGGDLQCLSGHDEPIKSSQGHRKQARLTPSKHGGSTAPAGQRRAGFSARPAVNRPGPPKTTLIDLQVNDSFAFLLITVKTKTKTKGPENIKIFEAAAKQASPTNSKHAGITGKNMGRPSNDLTSAYNSTLGVRSPSESSKCLQRISLPVREPRAHGKS